MIYYTSKDLARVIGVKPDQIAKYTRDGKLKGKLTKRQGRPDRYVYYFKDVNNFIKLYEPRKKGIFKPS